MAEYLHRLLRGVNRIFHPLFSHADGRLNEVVHLPLPCKVPGMPLVPGADNQFAAIEEASPAQLGGRISFVPHYKLKCVKYWIESLVPLAQKVVAGEGKEIARWLENSHKLLKPVGRIENRRIPCGNIVIKFLPP